MKYKRYTGEFLSRAGLRWRVDILQEADAEFESASQLTFPADAPLSIEWQRKDKEEVLCGSIATLKIISPGDRTYQDLYSINVGQIRLDVYRDNVLYWSGCLDPEFYEEPYEQLDGYEVSLIFSDFGILGRIKYDLQGLRTLRELILYALLRTGISYNQVDTNYITTQIDSNTAITGGNLSIRSDNFIDEAGEWSTMEDVVNGILQPLAIKMIQRAGIIYLYDINGLYTKAETKVIEWDGDRQVLGVDKVANNVKITFSPYSSGELMKGDVIDYKDKYDVNHVNLTSEGGSEAGYGQYYSYYPDYSDTHKVNGGWDYNLIDFTIFISDNGKGLKSIGNNKYFHILPVTGSVSESSGVAYAFRTGGHGGINTGWPKWKIHSGVPRPSTTSEILTANRVFLPGLPLDEAEKYKVRLAEEILLDCRYNPFSGSTEDNDDGNDKYMQVRTGFLFIPVKITLYDDNGIALYHYDNHDTVNGSTVGHLGYAKGKWAAGADVNGDAWLEYYNADNLKDDCGVRGWKANRHAIGRPDGTFNSEEQSFREKPHIYDSFKKMADGEYMPYPPCGGWMEVRIMAGIKAYDYGSSFLNVIGKDSDWDIQNVREKLRWCLYKAPKLDVVNYNLVLDSVEIGDVEYSGYINKSAKDDISIDTICGTGDKICPTAKGIYYKTSVRTQIQQLTRAARTDHPEKLLIGTMYSQYAERKTTLSGEAIICGGLFYYTEQNQGDKRFMLLSDVQNVITDCTDAEFCEIRPDEFTGKLEEVE